MRICMSGYYDYPDDKKGCLWVVTTGATSMELLVGDATGENIISAYKQEGLEEKAFNNMFAREIAKDIKQAMGKCKEKKVSTAFTKKGIVKRYSQSFKNLSFTLDKLDGQFCGTELKLYNKTISLNIVDDYEVPQITYTTLKTTLAQEFKSSSKGNNNEIDVAVRSLEEIALMGKDITWVKNKKYHVILDELVAEQLILSLENWKSTIVVDYETTGLRINKFGEVGSPDKENLKKINEERVQQGLPAYRVDEVVGIIFCVEPNSGYYLPMRHRKFKNLYSDINNPTTRQTAEQIKTDYITGKYSHHDSWTAEYVRKTPITEWSNDIILMLRLHNLLHTKDMGAHHGSFEYKCSLLYGIDLNLKEDSMLLHQLMWKFKDCKTSRGNKSDLKTLTKKEFSIDQLDLGDFFVGYSEEQDTGYSISGKSKKKRAKYIDFSYMDLEGTHAYGPADGDFSLQLIFKYKNDLYTQFDSRLQYLYNVEIVTACAIGYMEFYGHRIDENKIKQARIDTIADQIDIERQIRDMIEYNTAEELKAYEELSDLKEEKRTYEKMYKQTNLEEDRKRLEDFLDRYEDRLLEVRSLLDNSDHPLNLNAPKQVADLLYDKLGVPIPEDGKKSVQKRSIQPFADAKTEDNKLKYPAVSLYMSWKNCGTLLQKFFGSLTDFMYPGGFIFSNYGQITTATGRMSCSKPNAQQYPKAITAMVIPREGCIFVDADYSQIEYRTMVALAQEPKLMKLFQDPDNDYHTIMASLMFGVPYAEVTDSMRSDAKTFNFGIPYGMGIKKLAFQLRGREDEEAVAEAKEKYELYFRDQPKVQSFFNSVKENARDSRFTETKWGRRRYYVFEDEFGNIDEKNMNGALRQAGNAVIQGTAADIFKIGVARNFMFIRENNLLGKMFITNMIHDEQLIEIDYRKLDVGATLAHIIYNMQIQLDGFPPLFVGAGVGTSWKYAKGKEAEIHPFLGQQIMEENINKPLFVNNETMTQKDVLNHYEQLNYHFREKKILDYITNEEHFGQPLLPVIAALLNLQFDYGVKSEINERFPSAEEGITWEKKDKEKAEHESNLIRLERFISARNLDLSVSLFKASDISEDVEQDNFYEDDEDIDFEVDAYGNVIAGDFKVLNEDDKFFGCDIKDIIREFGLVISPEQRICGVFTAKLSRKVTKNVMEYLSQHCCDPSDKDALRVVFLRDGNTLFRTEVYVKGLNSSKLGDLLHLDTYQYDTAVNS